MSACPAPVSISMHTGISGPMCGSISLTGSDSGCRKSASCSQRSLCTPPAAESSGMRSSSVDAPGVPGAPMMKGRV